MNSYPAELLTQLAPVMFVAGLDAPPSPNAPTGPQAEAQSPPPTPTKPQDAFTILKVRLRDALVGQRQVAIWQPDKSKSFQVFLVDKDIRFPPRKLVPPDDPQYQAAHSPLSPLTLSSPLYPDGLIAPIWIRKHTTLLPSVFVFFLRIFELPPIAAKSPLDGPDPEVDRERELEERRRDMELSTEIAVRKKSTGERGIKLTVVLMASRRMLDDPSLDGRLTYIRRQSGLDSRAALFVLSPVSPSELGDFVRSLQQALYEPALEYYTNHSKRVRRKRNRHSQAVASYANPINPVGSATIARPLRPEGWTVRYEYKMACFAEFRGEDEVALKHYQDAYAMLVTMFGSTAILPPRTKRWAEAKVLADSINVKVSKLYLYNNEHALALSHHNTHMRKFGDFSRGWGIGEETFEFWSWMARQHRILAELLEHGTRSTLVIPDHRPVPPPSVPVNSASVNMPKGMNALDVAVLGLNPSHALHHPGFYYYMAARCTEMRRGRFLAAVDAEASIHSSSPGFSNEKKVDHLTIILELYTKSYELFKKYSPVTSQSQGQGRLTHWIAYRIAHTYYESGKFEMAVRFFERIAKTYRREKWNTMLRPLLSTWYTCAQKLGDVELSVRLLVEMLGHGTKEDSEEPNALEEDLLAVLKTTEPSSMDGPLIVDLSESEPLLESTVVFWTPTVVVGERAAFQLSLTAPPLISIASLPITALTVEFSNDIPPITVRHTGSVTGRSPVRRVSLGHIANGGDASEIEAYLRWQPGSTVVFSGTMSSDTPVLLEISKLLISVEERSWRIQIPVSPRISHQDSVPTSRWLSSLEPVRWVPILRDDCSSVVVQYRPHQLQTTLVHKAPAYLEEEYPIIIDVTNVDDRELDVIVDVLLQPTEIDNAVNSIIMDDERSSGLIKGVPLGVIGPGVNVRKTLYLANAGAPGDRMIDVSIQSRSTATPLDISTQGNPDASALVDATETLETLVVPTVAPMKVTYTVSYQRSLGDKLGLADLRSFESDYWEGEGDEAVVNTKVECVGPWSLEIEDVKLIRRGGDKARVIYCSSDSNQDIFPGEYCSGDEFCHMCRITLAPEHEENFRGTPIPGPGEYEVIWRRLMPTGMECPQSTTRIPLPSLKPPSNGLIALIKVPPVAKLHVPISLHLTIRNNHPSRSANVTVQLEPDPSDGFVVAGLRNGRVPILLSGAEEKLVWRLIPVECGYVQVPRLKVVDRRANDQGIGGPNAEAEGEGVPVNTVDIRWDSRKEDSDEEIIAVKHSMESRNAENDGKYPDPPGFPSILVLP